MSQEKLVNAWDLGVACDVALGKFFQNGSNLPADSYINVDSGTIAEALKAINPTITGKLLFTAADENQSELKAAAEAAGLESIGGLTLYDEPSKQTSILVSVSNNGQLKSAH
ncbi:MAG TPA: hypothetical protein VII55_02845, partial [Candidatus Saccharimonadales bacterium]